MFGTLLPLLIIADKTGDNDSIPILMPAFVKIRGQHR